MNLKPILKYFGKDEEGTFWSQIFRGSASTFSLMIASMGMAYITSVLLARLLGATGYGIYVYSIAWVTFLTIPATLGFDALLVREVAAQGTQESWGLTRGILRWTNQIVLGSSIGLGILAAIFARFTNPTLNLQVLAIWIALIALPFTALSGLRRAAMRGIHKPIAAHLPEMIGRTLLLIVLIGASYLFLGINLNPLWAILIYVISILVSFLLGERLLSKALPINFTEITPQYRKKLWLNSALPLVAFGGLGVINDQADLLMLGAIKGPEVVGIYVVSVRGAQLVSFILGAVNIVLAPKIANLYTKDDFSELQHVVTVSARLVLLASLPIAVSLWVFGYWLLQIFGPEFAKGQLALNLLTFGQLINAAAGSVGQILTMTNYELDAVVVLGISAFLNVTLNLILIPQFGLEGAAFATVTSMISWNILLSVLVYVRLKIYPTAAGKLF